MKMLLLMAKALTMDTKDMVEQFDEGLQGIRMNYYPPCPQPDLVIGLTPHSDAIGLTTLLQVNEVEGLQIITNGNYRSIEPRVTVNSMKERLSVATFYSPKLECEMGPAPSLITPEKPAFFRRIGVGDYFRGHYSRELRGKSYLDVMRTIQDEEKKGN
ncbi:hypothetical protein NL676_008569 [Syzygium grande]|nr:hypothetical protein NL676_008569 [Syzygium grande]